MSRRELLELLIEQGKKVDQLQEQLDEANARLKSRQIQIASAGSIAEAALQLNHIFEDAQAAADQYLENVKARCDGSRQAQTDRPDETKLGEKAEWEILLDRLSQEYGQGEKG